MGNQANKDSKVPPGVKAERGSDGAGTEPGQTRIKPDGDRVCSCCHKVTPASSWIALLQQCEDCATTCDGGPKCIKNMCKCPGDCCAEHKAGERCEDTALLVIGRIGQAVLEVCTACAIELAKKTLLPS